MASEIKTVKRKSTAESAKPTKKVKKASSTTEVSGNGEDSFPTTKPVNTSSPSSIAAKKSSRKRAADFLDDAETEAISAKPAPPSKPHKRTKKDSNAAEVSESRKAHLPKRTDRTVVSMNSEDSQGSERPDEDVTAALLAGFESSDEDESDDENEINNMEPEGLSLEQLPKIPNEAEAQKQSQAASKKDKNEPGVIYIGRIPHGFYEPQMRAYFSQFGKIKRLRLSRNKKTGRSKHYAFIEFAFAEVADIVARTMNKYLMFGHILQVAVIPPGQVHEKLFLGANKRFRPMPRNKLEGKRLGGGMERDVWAKRITAEEQRRQEKAKKLQELGYEFEFPVVRQVEAVPVKDVSATEAPAEAAKQEGAKPENVKNTREADKTVKSIEDKPEIANFTDKLMIEEKGKKGQKSKKTKRMATTAP
ncbi:MAG: hypothetical protein M1821_006051 [Bathelium mastoideum]|nr:MAG: hypothetical protein M1821_006051 [Bathelium mastoideum]KAI9688416.1 MAG: hypothetical protein M1822_001365 [Bathelium mastoideum]